jgi:predicted nucleic-acid-binding protein
MIGIDTNVLVRYITADEPKQFNLARNLLEKQCSKENPGVVNLIVLCELVWVLRGAYKTDKRTLVAVLRKILGTAELSVETPDMAWAALDDFEKGNADFSDYLIAHKNKELGCTHTVTFDKKAGKHTLIKTLE